MWTHTARTALSAQFILGWFPRQRDAEERIPSIKDNRLLSLVGSWYSKIEIGRIGLLEQKLFVKRTVSTHCGTELKLLVINLRTWKISFGVWSFNQSQVYCSYTRAACCCFSRDAATKSWPWRNIWGIHRPYKHGSSWRRWSCHVDERRHVQWKSSKSVVCLSMKHSQLSPRSSEWSPGW